MRLNLAKLFDFKSLGDPRGNLVALESELDIPIAIKRVYYIFGTISGVARGFHAHKKLQQIAICVSGSCTVLLDDGVIKEEVNLASPEQGVLIDRMIWHEMYDFSEDCVLLVLADEYYDEADYIRDYESFREVIKL